MTAYAGERCLFTTKTRLTRTSAGAPRAPALGVQWSARTSFCCQFMPRGLDDLKIALDRRASACRLFALSHCSVARVVLGRLVLGSQGCGLVLGRTVVGSFWPWRDLGKRLAAANRRALVPEHSYSPTSSRVSHVIRRYHRVVQQLA